MIKNKPLVTLAVITYNSSKYILNTLNSILGQTYPNIELIISDDCSTDNTPEIIDNWLLKHSSKFTFAKFIKTPKNIGVSGNCNNAIRAGKGEWIKLLSGDDQFFPYTIEKYMEFVENNPTVNICFAKFDFFSDNEGNYFRLICKFYEEEFYSRLKLPLKKQKKEILKALFVPGPGTFFSRNLYDKVNGFDEKYPFCEEDPFYGRIILEGNRIHFIDKKLYRYNLRHDSLGHEGGVGRHGKDRMRYFFDERFKNMLKYGLIFPAINEYLSYKSLLSAEKGNYIKSNLYTFLRRISPYMLIRYIEYRKGKKLEAAFK